MDGWCRSRIVEQVDAAYAALCHGEEPDGEPSAPYGAYVAWLARHADRAGAEKYWRAALLGFRRPTPLGVDGASDRPTAPSGRYGRRRATSAGLSWMPCARAPASGASH